jgi:hypothetical protein
VVESKTTKGQTIIYKILYRKQKTEQHQCIIFCAICINKTCQFNG